MCIRDRYQRRVHGDHFLEQMEDEKTLLISQVAEMGFSTNAVERAWRGSANKTIDGLIEWLGQHEADPDLNDPLPANPEEPQPGAGKSISSMVNQAFATKLQELGNSKNVSEKALLLTGNKSVEDAIQWIYENKDEPDFEEELTLVEQEGGGEQKPKVVLTPEEAAKQAMELQRMLREKRLAREKEEEREREKERVRSGKEMAMAKKMLDEAELKREAERKMREKKEDEVAKAKILEQLQRDREERFGKGSAPVKKKEEEPLEKVKFAISQMKVVYPTHSYGTQLKTCFQTLKIYLENVLKNPGEDKFRKINMANKAFQERIQPMIGAVNILNSCGFVEDQGTLVMLSLIHI
eukprot:TRINITY_DN4825_c0_g1_i1.p1 TRINITY_DN4825_c0_g1~~TRINITY_DN4825_c0_g1_i1.p1  ORF type:complete len:352 (-),score=117.89 TRINITY_DN4825_c0_g1_i1:62-1117(-)